MGYLVGIFNEKRKSISHEDCIEKRKEKSSYVPRFLGYYRNEGTYFNEDWKWIEPEFRKRYLNIYRENTRSILTSSWIEDINADEICECDDQRELELMIDCYKDIEKCCNKTVIYENEGHTVYINVELNNKMIISIDEVKKDNCHECIACFDSDEVREILPKVQKHYVNYGDIEIKDSISYKS